MAHLLRDLSNTIFYHFLVSGHGVKNWLTDSLSASFILV